MNIAWIMLIFTLLAFLGFLIVSERVRYNLQREWREPHHKPKSPGTHH